jgi:hypothetical protein
MTIEGEARNSVLSTFLGGAHQLTHTHEEPSCWREQEDLYWPLSPNKMNHFDASAGRKSDCLRVERITAC